MKRTKNHIKAGTSVPASSGGIKRTEYATRSQAAPAQKAYNRISKYTDFAKRFDAFAAETDKILSRSDAKREIPSISKDNSDVGAKYQIKMDEDRHKAEDAFWGANAKSAHLSYDRDIGSLREDAAKLLEDLEEDKSYLSQEDYELFKDFLKEVEDKKAFSKYDEIKKAIKDEALFRESFASRSEFDSAVATAGRYEMFAEKYGVSEDTGALELLTMAENARDRQAGVAYPKNDMEKEPVTYSEIEWLENNVLSRITNEDINTLEKADLGKFSTKYQPQAYTNTYMKKPDFEKLSGYKYEGMPHIDTESFTPNVKKGEELYWAVNDPASRVYLEEAHASLPGGGDLIEIIENIKYMAEDEIAVFNYIYHTEGAKAAEKYIYAITSDTDAFVGLAHRRGSDYFEKNIKGSTAKELLYSFEAGLDNARQGARQLLQSDAVNDTYKQHAGNYAREDLSDTWDLTDADGSVATLLYDLGHTTSNMLPGVLLATGITMATNGTGSAAAGKILANAAGALTTGSTASGNAYTEAKKNGYSDEESRNYALLVGASESTLQYLLGGITALGGVNKYVAKALNKIDNVLIRASVSTVINMGGEFTEEYLQEVLNPVFRNICLDENNEVKPFSEEALYAGILGALSAAGFDVAPAVGTVVSEFKNKKTVEDGLREYSKKDSINGVLLGFVDSISKMKDKMKISKRKQSLGSISTRHSNLLSSLINNETGKTVDFSDFELWIDGSAVEHIETRHGKNGEADRSMSNPEDIARIPWAVNNADRASFARNSDGSIRYNQTFRNSDGTLAPVILIEKSIGNDSFIVAECAPDTKAKKINVISAYIQKNSSSNQVMNIDPDGSPHPTPETPLDSTATNVSISENGEIVNSTGQENIENGTNTVQKADKIGNSTATEPALIDAVEGDSVSIESASKKYGAQSSAMTEVYRQGQDVAKFDNAFRNAYNMGLAGVPLSYTMDSSAAAYLSETQRQRAWEIGRDADILLPVEISKSGKVTVTVDEKKIDAKKIEFHNAKKQSIYDAIIDNAKYFTADEANAVISAFMENTSAMDADAFVSDWLIERGKGYLGDSKADYDIISADTTLTEKEKSKARTQGHLRRSLDEASRAMRQEQASGHGRVNIQLPSSIRSTKQGKAAVMLSKTLALSGVNVNLITAKQAEGERIQGKYNPATNTVTIAVYTGADFTSREGQRKILGKVFAHELTHYIEEWNPEQYEVLRDYIIEAFNKNGKGAFETFVREYSDQYGISLEEAESEVIADSCTMMLKNSETVERMVRKNRTLAQKISAFIESFVAKLKGAQKDIYTATDITIGTTADSDNTYAASVFLENALGDFGEMQKLWDNALEGALENNSQKAKVTAKNKKAAEHGGEAKLSREEDVSPNHIEIGMSDEERTRILNRKSIVDIPQSSLPSEKDLQNYHSFSWEDINKVSGKDKRGLILKLAEEFGAFKEYENRDIDLSFEFSKNNYRESYGKQKKNFEDFGKMFSVFDVIIDKAVGIEVHKREDYKPDATLKNVYVLISAFQDGEFIIPVKLEIKEFFDKQNTLYVAIALEKIKKTEVSKQGTTENGVAQNSRSVIISISDLMRAVNPIDTTFTKYFPRNFLTEDQIEALEAENSDSDSPKISLSRLEDIDMPDITRTALADALEGLAQNDAERQLISEYRENADSIDEMSRELREVNAQIKEISFTKDSDRTMLPILKERAAELNKAIDKADKALYGLRAGDVFKRLTAREKTKIEKKLNEKWREKAREIRKKGIEKVKAQQEKARESRQKIRDGRKATELRGKIRSFRENMVKTLKSPTDRRYIPFFLAEAIIDICDVIAPADSTLVRDDGTVNKAQLKREGEKNKLEELRNAYEQIKDSGEEWLKTEFDEAISESLRILTDKYKDKDLNSLSLEDLEELYSILKSVDGTLKDARNLIGEWEGAAIQSVSSIILSEQNRISEKRRQGLFGKATKANDAITELSLSPVRAILRISGYNEKSYLYRIATAFEDGVRKKDMFIMQAYKAFEKLTAGINAKKYDDACFKDVEGFELTDVHGRKFKISKMQMMQAVLSYEREIANNLRHLRGEGQLTFADLKMLRKGELQKAVDPEYSHRIGNAEGLISQFISFLENNSWAQEYMNTARQFFNGTAKDALNSVYLQLKHRAIATQKAYIPFECDPSFIVREISGEYDIQQTINSYGLLQEMKNGASQPLIVTGLNNIIDRHIDRVGTIYGLAVPIRNFNKIWNSKPVSPSNGSGSTIKELISYKWGKGGAKLIEQTVQDLQGPRKKTQNKLYNTIESNYIGATFLTNLSVVSKQIGSMYAARSMLRWRSAPQMMANLINTMARHKKIAAEVDKYTAAAWKRRQGMSSEELHTLVTEGRKHLISKVANKLPAFINPAKWITAMDYSVALSLWKYSKQDVAKRTGLKGEELLEATAEFYNSVIENTQSMADILHRPEIQKKGDFISRSFGLFKTDLYQMAGQLRSAAGKATASPTKENIGEVAKAVYGCLSSTIWASLMTTLFAMLRYKVDPYRDEEDEDLTWESWLTRQGFTFFGDVIGYLAPLGGSELVGTIENIKYGESSELVDSLAMSAVNDFGDDLVRILGKVFDEDKDVELKDWNSLIVKGLQCLGVPANNISRFMAAVRLHTEDIKNGEFLSFEAGADRSAKQHIHRIAEAIDKGNVNVAIALFDEAVEDIAFKKSDDGEIGDIEIKEAKSDLISAVGDKYKEGKISKQLALKTLRTCSDLSNEEITEKVNRWTCKVATGIAYDDIKDEFISGNLSMKRACEMYSVYGGMSKDEAKDKVEKIKYIADFEKEYPEAEGVSYNRAKLYREYGESAGIDITVFLNALEYKGNASSDKDADGEVITTAKDKVIDYIDGLKLSDEQKDALYLACDYAESGLWKTPWK